MRPFACAIAALLAGILSAAPLRAQDTPNAFLVDFEPREAVVPRWEEAVPTTAEPTVTVEVQAADTLAQVSPYLFGHAVAVWIGSRIVNPTVGEYLRQFAPTFIRFPGGSWADIFFWDSHAPDLPDSLINGTTGETELFYPQFGRGSWPTTVDDYYRLREQAGGAQGLITVNYGYARYGTGPRPVEQAAHYAADWVRFDNGRTRFWEIGNENAGPWEAGWQIDTARNQDGQPEIITGALYGRHFRIFADSMRAAAAEIGATIYIGGQILHYDGTNSWNVADREWNEGFFREAGESPDFYVVHNYFGANANASYLLSMPITEVANNMRFIQQDIAARDAAIRPVALTEYNMGSAGALATGSFIRGMQAVILFGELIENGYSLSARWLIANGEDGLFYDGDESGVPPWNPHPTFFYLYYMPRFVGDHLVATSSTSSDVLAYASRFESGHAGIVLVNKGLNDEVVDVALRDQLVGDRFYQFSLTGGTDNGQFSQVVHVNGVGPSHPTARGPIDELEDIPARAYPIGRALRVEAPARSVQFVLIEPGDRSVAVEGAGLPDSPHRGRPSAFPNPTSGRFTVDFGGEHYVRLEIVDVLGRRVFARPVAANDTSVEVRPDLSAGVYFVRLVGERGVRTTRVVLR